MVLQCWHIWKNTQTDFLSFNSLNHTELLLEPDKFHVTIIKDKNVSLSGVTTEFSIKQLTLYENIRF